MQDFTRYLSVRSAGNARCRVAINDIPPISLLQDALNDRVKLRYSPIFPAYLAPGQEPGSIPKDITSIAFFFSRSPYQALGRMKPDLPLSELERIYFSQGLASILCINCDMSRARELRQYMDTSLIEYWPICGTELNPREVVIEHEGFESACDNNLLLYTGESTKEVTVYLEQIYASIVALRNSYAIYNPNELRTLDSIARLTKELAAKHHEFITRNTDGKDIDRSLDNSKRCYAIISALAEISAALSYAVTQGTSGCAPILSNPCPFPHFSLLGVGGTVRALTKFTRYLESAFSVRDVFEVIARGYSCRSGAIPARISQYNSGNEYRFSRSGEQDQDEFDRGGAFPQKDDVPLIIYLSLRHGFKESKFSITAASETLTAEVLPQWTMMTLSHEIMHNRVRLIFQALFGASWNQDRYSVLSEKHYLDFKDWYEVRDGRNSQNLDCEIRNAILNFCLAMDRANDIRTERRKDNERSIPGINELAESYGRHKLRAMELFVHFHDYYFAYAAQQKLYAMSLWASWISVAAPYNRPMDYLIRTLATLACGTGLEPGPAFDQAAEIFVEALGSLEHSGVHSALFDKLRNLLKDPKAYANFKPSYYLIDQVGRFFASRAVASRIDRIEDDPFAEGSTSSEDYTANSFVYGEADDRSFVSPIRFCLASLLRTMSAQSPMKDIQWLTAWNTIVISSQEVINAEPRFVQSELHR